MQKVRVAIVWPGRGRNIQQSGTREEEGKALELKQSKLPAPFDVSAFSPLPTSCELEAPHSFRQIQTG